MSVRNNLLTVLYMICIMADFKQSHWFCPSSCNPEISISNSVPHWNTYFCLFVCFCFFVFFQFEYKHVGWDAHGCMFSHNLSVQLMLHLLHGYAAKFLTSVLAGTHMDVCMFTHNLSVQLMLPASWLCSQVSLKPFWFFPGNPKKLIKIKTCLHRVRF